MVLQNKFKARASRRYNAARGGVADGRGRGGGGRGGRGGGHRFEATSFPSLPGQEDDNEAEAGSEGDAEQDKAIQSDEEEQRAERAKYAPRKIQSNAWRYAEPEAKEAEEGEEKEVEDEIDLSGLLERVARLDSSRTSKTLLRSESEALQGIDEDLNDVDVSLLHLLAKNRLAKEGAASKGVHNANGTSAYALSDEQVRELEEEGRRLLEEKARQEKHERRARILKQSTTSISINIGENRSDKKVKNSVGSKENRAGKYDNAVVDSDDDDAEAEGNDTDFFLRERLEVGKQAASRSSHAVSTEAQPRADFKQTTDDREAEEDFLDTIL